MYKIFKANKKALDEWQGVAFNSTLGDYLNRCKCLPNDFSFNADQRSCQMIINFSYDLDQNLQQVATLGGDIDDYKEKYINFFLKIVDSRYNTYHSLFPGIQNITMSEIEEQVLEKFAAWKASCLDPEKKNSYTLDTKQVIRLPLLQKIV